MEVTIYPTFAGMPAISVPAGFHANGRWPMGLQLIGHANGDAELVAAAAGYEVLIGDLLARRPAALAARAESLGTDNEPSARDQGQA